MTTPNFNPLSDEDHAILAAYFPIADGIAALLGKQCEVVLHSLEFLEQSAIYVVNGHLTDRKIGSPISAYTLQSLQNMQTDSVSAPYLCQTENGTSIRSVTVAIRNHKQLVIGLLCISVNLDVPLSQLAQLFVSAPAVVNNPPLVVESPEALVHRHIANIVQDINTDERVANHNKNRKIITALFERGVFEMKEAIQLVADKLGISRHTVYLYIRQMKQEEK